MPINYKNRKLYFWSFVFTFWIGATFVQSQVTIEHLNELMESEEVAKLYNSLTPDQRIAQLFWITAEEIQNRNRFESRIALIKKYQPGGILFMKNDVESIMNFISASKDASNLPLIYSIDGEWGLAMRIDGIKPFPKQQTMGAVQNLKLHYRMGIEVANQFHLLGIHVNMAPVADVNCNRNNPIIGNRSFGENPNEVAHRAVAYMKGMQDGGIMSVAKHFPGHGDTNVDSHKNLPKINHDIERLESVELFPFRALIKNGVLGMMTGHIEVPELDTKEGTPASLSKPIIQNLLKNKYGFRGVVITDAMNMNGVKLFGSPGKIDALALIAGNDIIESTENLPLAIKEVKNSIQLGNLSWHEIEIKCKKALALKMILDVERRSQLNKISALKSINNTLDNNFLQQIYNASITYINIKDKVVLDSIDSKVLIKLSGFDPNGIISAKENYTVYQYKKQISNLYNIKNTKDKNCIFIGISDDTSSRYNWQNKTFQNLFNKWCNITRVVVLYYGNPYKLDRYKGLEKANAVILGYEKNSYTLKALNKILSGDLKPQGKLPVTINAFLEEGQGE